LAPRSRDSAFSDFYLRVILKAKNPHILEEVRNGFRREIPTVWGEEPHRVMATCDAGAFVRMPFSASVVKVAIFYVTLQRL